MKEINRKDHIIENGLFQAFDYIKYEDFSKGYSKEKTFAQREYTLQNLLLNLKHPEL